MRDIYEEAGLSPGAVYHYFAGKHDIIAASFDFDHQRSSDLFAAAAASEDPRGALVDLLSFLFHGLKAAAELSAPRVNVQGWGEALVNPTLHATVVRVLSIYREATTEIVRRARRRRGRSTPRSSLRRWPTRCCRSITGWSCSWRWSLGWMWRGIWRR